MTITIRATGMELTDAIRQYAEEKFEKLTKYFNNIQKVDIDVGMRTHRHQQGNIYFAEVNVSVPNKLVRIERDAEDLYKAIDKVKDHLKVELNELQQKMSFRDKGSIRGNKEYPI